jgi:sugar transferase (PEP-CTERM/EpsH1 system associated)
VKILYVCHRFPFKPNRGGKIRPFNMIRHLSQSHQVTVASLARSPEEAKEGEGIAPHCHRYLMDTVTSVGSVARMLAGAPTPTPASMAYFHSPRLARLIREELRRESFDLIFVHCSSVAHFVADVPGIPKILDFGDMDSQKWLDYAQFQPFPKSLVYRIEGLKMQRAEMQLARKFDLCTCTTRAEYETLLGFETGTPAAWFPNGVDLEFFKPSGATYDPNAIVFVGRMDYYPNQQGVTEFCDRVLPVIQAQRPEATFAIVGAKPSPEILELGKRPGVTVTGTVPDVRPHVIKAAVAIAPLRIARGTQNKILESLAMGVPVVSSATAAKGIDAEPGEHFLAADSAKDFAAMTLRLLSDAGERDRLAKAGRARMESHHNWPASMRRLDKIIEDCLSLKKRAA